MKIAIIGTNSRAEAIRKLVATGGYEVSVAGKVTDRAAGEEAAKVLDSDVLILAGSPEAGDGLVGQAGRFRPESIIIDAMDGRADRSAAEAFARSLGSNRIVRALMMVPDPGANILCCGDDADAMNVVKEIFRNCGCIPTDRGPLSNVDELEPPSGSLDEEFDTLKARNTVVSS
ncbi:MAG: hypothetical protein ABI231_08340 [Candidatus Tumulicola sp.]